jgi:hypothetical protein
MVIRSGCLAEPNREGYKTAKRVAHLHHLECPVLKECSLKGKEQRTGKNLLESDPCLARVFFLGRVFLAVLLLSRKPSATSQTLKEQRSKGNFGFPWFGYLPMHLLKQRELRVFTSTLGILVYHFSVLGNFQYMAVAKSRIKSKAD